MYSLGEEFITLCDKKNKGTSEAEEVPAELHMRLRSLYFGDD